MDKFHKLFVVSCVVAGLGTVVSAQTATEKYKDINVALAEGFIPDPSGLFISAAEEGLPPEWGAMGVHYLNMAALKITGGDPRVVGDSTHTDTESSSGFRLTFFGNWAGRSDYLLFERRYIYI